MQITQNNVPVRLSVFKSRHAFDSDKEREGVIARVFFVLQY